jgi:hypothetical protein
MSGDNSYEPSIALQELPVPDWERLIHARLDLAGKTIPYDEGTLAELAAHLEDLFEHWQDLRLHEEEAVSRTLAELPDWEEVFLNIRRARDGEDFMNVTAKSTWLPGIVALLVSLCGLIGAFRNDMFGSGFYLTSDISLLIYIPWLGTEVLAGFLLGYLSKRKGGQRNAHWGAAVLVSVTLFALFVGELLVYGVVAGPVRSWTVWGRLILYELSCVLLWVVVPTIVLVAGATAFWVCSAHLSLKNRMTTE